MGSGDEKDERMRGLFSVVGRHTLSNGQEYVKNTSVARLRLSAYGNAKRATAGLTGRTLDRLARWLAGGVAVGGNTWNLDSLELAATMPSQTS